MTLEQAKRILHPATSREALIGYSNERGRELVKEACVVACVAIDKLESIKEWVDKHEKNDLQ